MFYIAKLARRLAQSRRGVHFGTMLALLLITACAAGEPTSMDSASTPDDSERVVVSPRPMTLEGNQSVRFAAYDSYVPGSAELTAIEWTATGGSIGTDGSYTSGGEGEFKVIGKKKGGQIGRHRPTPPWSSSSRRSPP